MLLLCVMMTFVMFGQPAFSQIRSDKEENSERLDQLRKQIEESSEKAKTYEEEALAIRREVQKIQEQLIKSASEIQATEDQIFTREANLKELRAKEIDLEKKLKQKNFEMASTLGAMERLSIQKTSVVAFRPDEAINSLRTTALLKVILPDLKNRASIIEDDLSDLNKVRDDIIQENIELKNDLTKLVISNNEIDVLLKKRLERQKNLELSTKQERDKLKTFAENAKDLQDLLSKIEREIALREEAARRAEESLRDKPETSNNEPSLASIPMPDGSDFASAKGSLPLPVRGSIDQIYDQMLSTGQRSKGIVVDTLAGATVIAPHEGRIVYAGKFRSYGQLLIISHGEGYHTLLAGMENINGIVGQWVLKGEPIGQMSSDTGQSNSRQKLYVELRLKGKPINPLPWIVAMDRGGK